MPDSPPAPARPPLTYEIAPGYTWIRCLRCGATSHNSDDIGRLWCGRCNVFHEGERPDWWRAAGFAPPPDLLESVADRLTQGATQDGWTFRLLQLMRRADGHNRQRLAIAFPREAAALEAWEASDGGPWEMPEFQLPAALCGCPVGPGVRWSRAQVREHYRHTWQVLILWELLMRLGEGQDVEAGIVLGNVRAQFLEVLHQAFPELVRELSAPEPAEASS